MRKVRIKDLCELRYGKALKKENRKGGSVPVYGSNGIVGYHDEPHVKKKTIIIGRKGSIGEVHLVKVPSWPIDTTYFVDFKVRDINIEWFYRKLKTLRLNELNRSAAIPGLNRDDVYRIKIHRPPFDDQIRIATLLSRVETLIDTRKDNLRLLDEFLKSTFLEMFGDPVRNAKGWDEVTLDTICSKIVDCSHSTPEYSDYKTGYFCIRSSDIANGKLNLSETKQVSQKVYEERTARHIPIQGDVLYTREGGRLGNAALVPSNSKVCLGQRIMLFKANTSICTNEYLWALLESDSFKRKVMNLVGGGAAPRVNIKDLRIQTVVLPPIDLQNQFATTVEKVETLKTLYQQNLSKLEYLYGALCQKAFKGELDLSWIPLEKQPKPQMDANGRGYEKEIFDLDRGAMSDPAAREQLLRQLFDAFIAERKGASFSLDDFWTQAEQKVADDMDEESLPLGVADYDKAKAWLFDLLKSGQAVQRFNDENNRMELDIKG